MYEPSFAYKLVYGQVRELTKDENKLPKASSDPEDIQVTVYTCMENMLLMILL